MKAVIPAAGIGKRLRPLTNTTPKALVSVAGKPLIGHILDRIKNENFSETIFITGYLNGKVEEYVKMEYPNLKCRFVIQKEMKGTAHAISLVKEYVDEPVLIIFGDTVFEGKIKLKSSGDGAIGVSETNMPKEFGIVELENNYIKRMIERPENPTSNLAMIGMYFIKNYKMMFECVEELLKKENEYGKEYILPDALQLMIDKGAKLETMRVGKWLDCGNFKTLLETNALMLNKKNKIDESAKVENSKLEENVSVGRNAVVKNSRMRNVIVDEGCEVENCELENSVLGKDVRIKNYRGRVILGDFSEVIG